MSNITFKALKREKAGKGAARACRREGRVPAVIYGGKQEPVMISLHPVELEKALDMRGFYDMDVEIVLDGKKVVGLVSIEDILEELVGEIFDEEDIVDKNFQTLGGNKYMVNTHMLVSTVYERMGIGRAPRNIASKPLLSFLLETLGHLPEEDESFVYNDNMEFTAKTLVDGRITEVLIHILDEDDIAERESARLSAEVNV